MPEIKIAFMGTPEFAVPSLEALLKNNNLFSVKAVYSQPDKPVGRKQVLTAPPVKLLAQEYGIPVFQPEKIRKNQEVIDHLTSLDLDFIVVVAYGKILPESILKIPARGCINVHGSLLEKYRGAAPIQWAIANGEKVTGITTMMMDQGMDTGDLLLKKTIEIEINDTSETLSKKLAVVGAKLLQETLLGVYENNITPSKQIEENASYAPILNKYNGEIDWNLSAVQIYNRFRAFNAWPSVYTFFSEHSLKIKDCFPLARTPERSFLSGQIAEINKEGIVVATGSGLLLVTRVQPSGGKEMSAGDFVRGYHLEPGFVFGGSLVC